MASEFISFTILFSLGISMVVAIGVTVTNVESGIAENVANQEITQILQDIKTRIDKELSVISWELPDPSSYLYSYQIDLPVLLAKRFSYSIEPTIDSNDLYSLSASGSFLDNDITVEVPLGLSTSNYEITGSLDSILDIHTVTFQKTSGNFISIEFSSQNK